MNRSRACRFASTFFSVVVFMIAGASAATAQSPAKDATKKPGKSSGGDDAPKKPSKLFNSDDVIRFTLTADLKSLFDDRDSVKAKYHPGLLTVADGGGNPTQLDVKLKTRGHWRRQKKNCGDIPPLRVDFSKKQPDGSVFEGENKLKLVTFCRKAEEFEQYVLREYLVYKVYNLLTPMSLNARLARVTYIDSTAKVDSLTRYGFFTEDEEAMAERNNATLVEATGAHFADLDPKQTGLVSAFFYMVGATDWSLTGLHNLILIQHKENGNVYPVAYDFDWTGIVWTRYAFPDYRLPIKSVRERLYRGDCRTAEDWQPILGEFVDHKEAIYDIYRKPSVPLDPRYAKQTQEYLDDFFKVLGSARMISGELIGPCQKGG